MDNYQPVPDSEMEALFGPPARHSEFRVNDTIRFKLRGREVSGLVTYVAAPSTTVSGRHAPCTYVVYVEGEITPTLVYQNEIIQ